jgi:Pyruvate/2-oxoacid:ferredoxin oxidoreductase gamma subunit
LSIARQAAAATSRSLNAFVVAAAMHAAGHPPTDPAPIAIIHEFRVDDSRTGNNANRSLVQPGRDACS